MGTLLGLLLAAGMLTCLFFVFQSWFYLVIKLLKGLIYGAVSVYCLITGHTLNGKPLNSARPTDRLDNR